MGRSQKEREWGNENLKIQIVEIAERIANGCKFLKCVAPGALRALPTD